MGAITSHSAFKLAYFRGAVAEDLRKEANGGMMAVGMHETDVRHLIAEIAPALTVACINSPDSVTVSGDKPQLEALATILQERNVFHRRLRVDVAYHSPFMKSCFVAYAEAVGLLERGKRIDEPCIMISSVTGQLADTSALCQVDYWTRNMLQPVQFSEALARLCCSPTPDMLDKSYSGQTPVQVLVEIGPHSALQSPIHDTLKTRPGTSGITYYSALKRQVSADRTLLSVVGYLTCHGFKVDHELLNSTGGAVNGSKLQRKVIANLPGYPFDHSHTYMPIGRLGREFRFRRNVRLDLLGKPVLDWNPMNPRWTHFLKVAELAWVADHKVSSPIWSLVRRCRSDSIRQINGAIIYPAAGMLVMAIEAANQLADHDQPISGIRLTNIYFTTALAVPESAEGIETQLVMHPLRSESDKISSSWTFRLFSCKDGQWQEHNHGRVHIEYSESRGQLDKSNEELERLRCARDMHDAVEQHATYKRTKDGFYTSAFKSGYTFGPSFKAMEDLIFSEEVGSQVTANVKCFEWEAVENNNHFQPHIVHPTTLDCILQTCLAAFSGIDQNIVPTAIPTEIEHLWISTSCISFPESRFVQARGCIVNRSNTGYEAAATALDQSSTKIVLEAKGIRVRFGDRQFSQSTTDAGPSSLLCPRLEGGR